MDVSKTSFVRYERLKDVFCTLWTSQRRLLYDMNVSKTSFVRYGCLKDVFCTLLKLSRDQGRRDEGGRIAIDVSFKDDVHPRKLTHSKPRAGSTNSCDE